jgi:uncharacterized protein (DUF4415 family)
MKRADNSYTRCVAISYGKQARIEYKPDGAEQKVAVSVRLDPPVLEWLKLKSKGKGI